MTKHMNFLESSTNLHSNARTSRRKAVAARFARLSERLRVLTTSRSHSTRTSVHQPVHDPYLLSRLSMDRSENIKANFFDHDSLPFSRAWND